MKTNGLTFVGKGEPQIKMFNKGQIFYRPICRFCRKKTQNKISKIFCQSTEIDTHKNI